MSRTSSGLAVLLLLLLCADWVTGASGHLPGTSAVAGLVGCGLIVVVSKALGRAGLQRPEPPDA
ncbi:MAG TPA: hypothetical protein VNN07_10940 [Candidatus Tectomicrobia bacterium]|nr:hypothetical protein [Candidatus Tectomicrobia bacterium]